jgi:thymidine kinase
MGIEKCDQSPQSRGMAKLYFYYASMNAGKSTTLLQADFNYRERGMETMLWTAALDDRYDSGTVTSRIGLHADANKFTPETDLWDDVTAEHARRPLACVLIDEAQFLSSANRFCSWHASPMKRAFQCLCYGLSTDFAGGTFPRLGRTFGACRCVGRIERRSATAAENRR